MKSITVYPNISSPMVQDKLFIEIKFQLLKL